MLSNKLNLSILAIIPARSGSKGLPRKNIIECAGKPLIAWSIEAALKSKYISDVLVTTDSEEIAEVAKDHGAWVPFLRRSNLAQDDSSVTEVVIDVLEKIKKNHVYDFVVLLQPTSPLRRGDHIDAAVEYYLKERRSDYETLASVYEVDPKNLLIFGINDNNNLYSHYGVDLKNSRRQNLPKCYSPNGAIFISPADDFCGFYSENTIPFIMGKNVSIDIDYKADLKKASDMLLISMGESG